MENEEIAQRITVTGVVQGVGFRPMVARLADLYGIRGWVLNNSVGVEIHAEGTKTQVADFVHEIAQANLPMLRLDNIQVTHVATGHWDDFRILASKHNHQGIVPLPVDLSVCESCVEELRQPGNRRYGYPYINCTDCGPRFSLIVAMPFDRPTTTMSAWPLCAACQAEYEDPQDRRYHAETICCPVCGPSYALHAEGRCLAQGPRSIEVVGRWLKDGKIVAIKGIGGFHLACDAENHAAVADLRERKFRKERPFAVMARDIETAREYAHLTDAHEALLESSARPIVLAPARRALPGVNPECRRLGIMLPYAPLHHLLFDHAPPLLVLTSGNRSNEPIAYQDEDAFDRLGGIADAFLMGQRPIARRVDDSLVAVRHGRPMMLRRSRGFAPQRVLRLPTADPILALGGELKCAVTLLVDGQAFVSQHLGDLDEDRTRQAFHETVKDLLTIHRLDSTEVTLVHDLHPQYYSTRFAASFGGKGRVAVQHHHAHVASVLAEHGIFEDQVVGVALDGTGYGSDGTVWGGEIFVGGLQKGFKRAASLRPAKLLGGDAAASFPVQAAAGYLAELNGIPDLTRTPFRFPVRALQMLEMAKHDLHCFVTTSAGRLFDAAAALLGFVRPMTYEGQAAMWLENLAMESAPQEPYPMDNLDWAPMLSRIISERLEGRAIAEIAYAFHAGLAQELARSALLHCRQMSSKIIAISGGAFQNELLTDLFSLEIERQWSGDFPRPRVISNEQVPVNDGGLSLGQAALAEFQR